MAVQVSYPGVYIDEVQSAGAIGGVGTSTAAFVGLLRYGEPNVPKKLFKWEDFLREFSNPSGPSEPPGDDDYLWYAVRGFYENGGKICYVTRVSNAIKDSAKLDDDAAAMTPAQTPQKSIELVARSPGNNTGNKIKVSVVHQNAAVTTLFRPSITLAQAANADDTMIVTASADDAAKFRVGDEITVVENNVEESVAVARVQAEKIFLTAKLKNNYSTANTKVRLSNPLTGTTVLRIAESSTASKLSAGSVITLQQGIGKAQVAIIKEINVEPIATNVKTYRVSLQSGLSAGFDFSGAPATTPVDVKSQEFTLTVQQGTGASKPYERLSMNPAHSRFYANIVNNDPNGLIYAQPVEPPNNTAVPFNRPTAIANVQLGGGSAEDRSTIGAPDYGKVLAMLARMDDINILAAPGVTDSDVQKSLIAHCEDLKDRFAILDSRRDAPISGNESVRIQRNGLDSKRGYGALYFPWVHVSAEVGRRLLLAPPSGHIAGVYARTDNSRGVHKSPAGVEATVNGVVSIEQLLSDDEQGDLNRAGINVIRVFQTGGRPVVWGARTTAQEGSDFHYISTRRLFLFIEESIQEGINWAVFEPNNTELWQKLKRTISAFLAQQWRDGALFGASEKEAFYVRIDEAINPPDQRALGRLNIEIGIKPAYPAEFIVVRIGIWEGGSDVTE